MREDPTDFKVKTLFLDCRNFKTFEHIDSLTGWLDCAKALTDLHLVNQEMEWKFLFMFTSLLCDQNDRRKFRLHFSTCLNKEKISLCLSTYTSTYTFKDDATYSFDELLEKTIYFANPAVSFDSKNQEFCLPDSFSRKKVPDNRWKSLNLVFTIPVVKVTDFLYLIGRFPRDLFRYLDRESDYLGSYPIKLHPPSPSSRVICPLKIGERRYINPRTLMAWGKGSTLLTEEGSQTLIPKGFFVSYSALTIISMEKRKSN